MTIYIWGNASRYENYQRAVELAGDQVQFGGDPEGCAALLLPGGGDLEPWRYGQKNTASRGLEPERDAAELALMEYFTTLRRPVLGICRGLQTVNVFFGGTLCQDISEHGACDGVDRRHRVRTATSPLQELCGETCVVNSAHHQAADRLGAGLQAIQWTDDGVIEALCHRTLPVWAVQWHPERLGKLGETVFQAFHSLCQ
ncbi:gamma-glutamyl-gamma-aminobutyrate hydrolase family protein [Dysosmobacter sp. NSJ-60]|nr:gamma-glutamyl-gamma-aminobutyrate hydrolase family protein [Dysosmobacter hominis]MBS5659283.1 gamma-glutamyl-gamma-aminobutyrate hydrolase family protein [Oscillibacter sp.]